MKGRTSASLGMLMRARPQGSRGSTNFNECLGKGLVSNLGSAQRVQAGGGIAETLINLPQASAALCVSHAKLDANSAQP